MRSLLFIYFSPVSQSPRAIGGEGRHAFGHFRDIVRDVAYSPSMGEFLTHVNNKAYAVAGTYPDEVSWLYL